MTAFSNFQTATVLIAEGKLSQAIKALDRAIQDLDRRAPMDADLRPHVLSLRQSVARREGETAGRGARSAITPVQRVTK